MNESIPLKYFLVITFFIMVILPFISRCGHEPEGQKQFCISDGTIYEKPQSMPGEGFGRWVQIGENKWVYYKDQSCKAVE